jgi:membrane protein YqaA with SNARE-associated domain
MLDGLIEYGYFGLFLASFLAATILPFSSEALLTVLLLGPLNAAGLLIAATIGNVLGSVLNYYLGYKGRCLVLQKWFRISEKNFKKTEMRFKKYGTASLLLAWMPVIGDPLTVAAGVLRVKLLWFILLVTTGKFLRYLLIVLAVESI